MFCILLFTVFLLQTEFAFSDDCETEWEKVGSKCLWKSSEKATRWENYRTCQQLGAAMVSPKTNEENAEIKKFIRNEPGWYWLSGYQFVTKFIWIDGERITYSDWNPGQPNQIDSERGACIQINFAGWDDDHCDNKCMQMCEKEINTQNEEEKPKKCDDEYQSLKDTKKYEELKQKLKDAKRKYKKKEHNFQNAKQEYEAEIKSMKNKITSQKKKIKSLQNSRALTGLGTETRGT